MEKMRIEIWSDVVCPFCYIGKRKFEAALAEFNHSDHLEIEYKSFLLNPDLITDTNISAVQGLAEQKGIPLDQAQHMSDQVTIAAKQVGLSFDFTKAITANTFDAHRFLHLAKKHGKQVEAKELLLAAYFTEGINVDDKKSLLDIGLKLDIGAVELSSVLAGTRFEEAVRLDIYEAQQFGIRGVPFFAFNREHGVSGAQDSEVFLDTLQKSFSEWKINQEQTLEVTGNAIG